MDWADDVTYVVHDLEDFYRVGLVPLDLLASDPLSYNDFGQGSSSATTSRNLRRRHPVQSLVSSYLTIRLSSSWA